MQKLSLLTRLQQYFSDRKKLKAHRKLLDKPNRTKKRFIQKYPYATLGRNTYGTPSIKHRHKDATLIVGSYCSIAGNVEIYLGGNHRTDWVSSYPFPQYFEQCAHINNFISTQGDVNIGSDVWLCANSVILSGVTIGHGAVVANSAVVTKDVPPYAIVGGNPAKLIRYRFDEPTRNALLASSWWDWPENEVLSVVEMICSEKIDAFLEYVKNRTYTNE